MGSFRIGDWQTWRLFERVAFSGGMGTTAVFADLALVSPTKLQLMRWRSMLAQK
jgi:hypothetical protein